MKLFIVLCSVCLCFSSVRAEGKSGKKSPPPAPVKAVFVIDAKTGRVLHAHNEDVRTQPASLTKMMTLLLTFRALRRGKISLNSRLKISHNAAKQLPCKLGVKAGETITVRNAILALVTKSANDIAVALGEFVGGCENTFVYMMNKEARRLGMTSTVFMNPSGWKNVRQLSTARDLSKLARALMREYPEYYRFFATKQFVYNRMVMKNHNRLVGPMEKGIVVDGIKTGYVTASGYNLAASAKQKGNRLIAIVLGGETAKKRDEKVGKLLYSGFDELQRIQLAENLKRRKRKKHSSKKLVVMEQSSRKSLSKVITDKTATNKVADKIEGKNDNGKINNVG